MSRQLCALITGCSTGLGWLTAQALVERGHTAVATMRELHGRNADKAASLEESMAGSAGALHVVELDVTSQDSVDAAVAEAERLAGPLDAAVNNAGYGGAGYVEAFTAAQLSDMFEVNVMGVHRVNRAVLPGMRERGAGVVITAGSTMGRMVLPYAAAYTSTKFALEGLLESLHYELKGTGVDVSILQLGAFETAFHGNMVGPADEVRVASYGEMASRPGEFWTSYGETISTAEAASPTLVSDAIVELIESPRGSTPLRLVIDPITGGAGVPELNEVGARIQLEVLGAVGADYLLA
jgi:NAD(P)-dependent dehydrogenase (short-subunit alcohol dehydrogenase family)